MKRARAVIGELLETHSGVLTRRDHPELAERLAYQLRLGRLRAILPGVYVDAGVVEDFALRTRALMAWDRDALLIGRAAAKVSFWSELRVDTVDFVAGRSQFRSAGFRSSQRRLPLELVVERQGLRHTSPALTALDLSITELGGNAIDTVLRTRAAHLDQLREALALTPGRRGNVDRRLLVLDSRDDPWSEAERDLHTLLRAAGIEGWKGNFPLELRSLTYWIDVAFPKLKLAIEVDGWEFHRARVAFESDRIRQNDLVLQGWTVLRFTATMIRDRPDVVVAQILEAITAASR